MELFFTVSNQEGRDQRVGDILLSNSERVVTSPRGLTFRILFRSTTKTLSLESMASCLGDSKEASDPTPSLIPWSINLQKKRNSRIIESYIIRLLYFLPASVSTCPVEKLIFRMKELSETIRFP
jgi:hypothetical protein